MADIVTLNVGGMIYRTARSTLVCDPDSMLGAMFSGRHYVTTVDHGQCFIDRDGSLFGYVLNFLRDSELILPKDFKEHDKLMKEAVFYQLQPLVDAIEKARQERRPERRKIEMADIVTLDVGGMIYRTARYILVRDPDSMLGAMFSGRHYVTTDDHGQYFIDRDGSLFGYVLNFLRDSELILPEDFKEHDKLMKEALFYQLQPLVDAIEKARQERRPERRKIETMEMNAENNSDQILRGENAQSRQL